MNEACASITLRPYQQEAIEAVLAVRRQGVRRMLVCLPGRMNPVKGDAA